jgi:Spy/CpxP family protein refolding chaperone
MTIYRKISFGCWVILILAAGPLTARADNPSPGPWSQIGHNGQRIREIYNQLGLTDAQKNSLEANKQQHRANMERLRQSIKTNRGLLREEIMKPQLDMAKIKELQRTTIYLLAQMEDSKLNSILAVRSILTPEQFTKFINLVHQHKQEKE